MELTHPYGVPFLKVTLDDFDVHQKELVEKAYFLMEKNRYLDKSNMGGFHSGDIGELDWNNFKAGEWFIRSANNALDQAQKKLKLAGPLELTNRWYIVNRAKSGEWNLPHNHPNSVLSGAFYVSCPDKSYNRKNERGRWVSGSTGTFIGIAENNSVDSLIARKNLEKQDHRGGHLIFCPPIEGELIIFPSSLLHMVSPHMGEKDRIMISFNTRIKTDDTIS